MKVIDDPASKFTQAKFNRYHDQLILAGGVDGLNHLYRMLSVSSASLINFGDSKITEADDTLVHTYDDHEVN